MGYLIKAITTEIVTAKVTLTSANLLTPGYIFDIPEYPAVTGFFWHVIYMNGQILPDLGNTPYLGSSSIHIQASFGSIPQYRFSGNYMQNSINYWGCSTSLAGASIQFEQFDKLQIHNPGILTGGLTKLNIYIGANLIPY